MKNTLVALSVAAMLATAPVMANKANAVSHNSEKETFKATLLQVFKEDPEILLEGIKVLQEHQRELQQAFVEQQFEQQKEKLFHNPADPVFNDGGEVTVVEFFDYRCGYCQKNAADIRKLLENNDNVRFVYKEVAIQGPTSVELHKFSLAVAKTEPKLYPAFHHGLMTANNVNIAFAKNLALELGIDVEKVTTLADTDGIQQQLDDNYKLMQNLGIRGTPAFYVGDEKLGGLRGYQELRAKVLQQQEKIMAKRKGNDD
ncbi:DsbA family protein [Enterovibrio norvegicus]|uniref:DsbA family protein n=1 Tax=Enterovibrio norvegicus TaxID=188144 RepID=UPI00352D2E8F